MITPELLAYVNAQKKARVSNDVIRQTLISQGWPATDVDQALKPNAQAFVAPPQPIDPRSGHGEGSPVPPEAKGWSWGAAGLSWIWGIRFKVWISFLALVGPLAYIWWIVLGIKGREWAWQHNRWSSVQEYQNAIKVWDKWGLILFVVSIGIMVLITIVFFAFVFSGATIGTDYR